MRPQIHSPRMALGRQIVTCLALVVATFTIAACGEEAPQGPKIPPETATALIDKLNDVKTNLDEGDCDDAGSAPSALDAVQEAVDAEADDIGPEIVADLRELLGDVEEKVNEFCAAETAPEEETSSSTTTESDKETTDEETSTTTTTTEETTTTESTTEPPTEEPDEPADPPSDPQGVGPNGEGPPGQEGGFDTEGGGGFAPRAQAGAAR